MKKDTFLWLTVGLGVGMLVSAVFTYRYYSEEQKAKSDPRRKRIEELLNEAEALLNKGKKARVRIPDVHLK